MASESERAWAEYDMNEREILRSSEPMHCEAKRFKPKARKAVEAAVRAEAVAEWREAVSEYLRLFDAEDWGVVEAEDRLRALLKGTGR